MCRIYLSTIPEYLNGELMWWLSMTLSSMGQRDGNTSRFQLYYSRRIGRLIEYNPPKEAKFCDIKSASSFLQNQMDLAAIIMRI